MLTDKGIAAEPYHEGMDNDQSDIIQNRFLSSKVGIVVATIAFGIGIEKEDIRKVIHYCLSQLKATARK